MYGGGQTEFADGLQLIPSQYSTECQHPHTRLRTRDDPRELVGYGHEDAALHYKHTMAIREPVASYQAGNVEQLWRDHASRIALPIQ